MSRSSNIRVRLLFDDCTPFRPGSVGRRKCWFLLNIDACRRITDVEYCIQNTFHLGRSSQIELLLDDFVLPPFEKSEIIKENDLIRVRFLGEGGLKPDEIEVEELHDAEPKQASKRKKANKEAKRVESSEGSVARTSRAKRKKKGTKNKDRHEDRLMNDREKTTEAAQMSRLDSLAGSPSAKNGTPKHSAKVHKRSNKNGQASTRHGSSSSSDSSSEDGEQSRPIPKAKSFRKVVGRRKVQPSKSLMQSSTQAERSVSPRTSVLHVGGSGNKQIKANVSNVKCNRSGPLHTDSESSSTEEETVARKRKPSLKSSGSGLLSKAPVADIMKSSKKKRNGMTRTESTSTSSSVSSMSSASSSSSYSDKHPPGGLQQKQTLQNNREPGVVLTTKTGELPECPVQGIELSSTRSASLKKSVSKSSAGHVRFSSDSDSGESEAGGGMQPSASGQPAQQKNLEPRIPMVETGTTEDNPIELEEPYNGVGDIQGKRSEHCNNLSSLDEPNCSTADGIQAKLLNIAGQKPKQSTKQNKLTKPEQTKKPVQLKKPEPPKKPKDYSSYPPLVGPPRSGDIIAYKILELSGLYTPEVSGYKEGEVINFNHSNSMMELRLSDAAMAAEPKRDGGKFEMEPEENEQSKPAPIDRLVLVTLPSLIEPKLIT